MTIQDKYDDLDNLICNLERTIDETDLDEFKRELKDVLYLANNYFKEVETEKNRLEYEEYRLDVREQEYEYRSLQGF